MNNENNFLIQIPDGVVFSVKLVPNSSCNKIIDFTNEYVRIKISSPPIENRANKELINYCSDLFKHNKSQIKLISGEKSKLKKILLLNAKLEDITQKLMFMLESINK